MKRLILVVVLLALATSAFAYDNLDLQNVTGFDWAQMTRPERVWFLNGFGTAIFALMDVSKDTTLLDIDYESREHFHLLTAITLFWQPHTRLTVKDMISGINAYYRQEGSLDIEVWRAYMEVMNNVELAGL